MTLTAFGFKLDVIAEFNAIQVLCVKTMASQNVLGLGRCLGHVARGRRVAGQS